MSANIDVPELIRELILRELHKEAHDFQQLKGGRNSRVFRVDCDDRSTLAAKVYYRSPDDLRDRMGCEFRALQFLKSEGVRQVATAFAADTQHDIAIYEYIDGQLPQSSDIFVAEIDQAVEFLHTLKEIADSGRADHLPPASEACFSIEAVLQNIDGRMRTLEKASATEPALADFLQNHLAPFRRVSESWCLQYGPDVLVEIPAAERTLSPSDFGFHNALRRADGRLVFLDLEYFGWDDPAKTIADFLLHPAMDLPLQIKQHFFSSILNAFPTVRGLGHRVRAVYPLFALKWCAILLNEFTREHGARRSFSVGAAGVWSGADQLAKARRLLAQVMNDYRDFPYHA